MASEELLVSANERDFILKALLEGQRVDGRDLLEMRRVRRRYTMRRRRASRVLPRRGGQHGRHTLSIARDDSVGRHARYPAKIFTRWSTHALCNTCPRVPGRHGALVRQVSLALERHDGKSIVEVQFGSTRCVHTPASLPTGGGVAAYFARPCLSMRSSAGTPVPPPAASQRKHTPSLTPYTLAHPTPPLDLTSPASSVVATVTASIAKPFPERPLEGFLVINAEILPMAGGSHEVCGCRGRARRAPAARLQQLHACLHRRTTEDE